MPGQQRDLGAEQPDPFRAGRGELREIEQQAGIEQKPDLDPVAGHCRQIPQCLVIGAAAGADRDGRGDALLDVGARADQHLTVVAVDDDDVAAVDPLRCLGDPAGNQR